MQWFLIWLQISLLLYVALDLSIVIAALFVGKTTLAIVYLGCGITNGAIGLAAIGILSEL